MSFCTLVFVVFLVVGAVTGAPWAWALAAFFGFAAIMTQIEIQAEP